MKKITKMPIGLGMNHLGQEIAACWVWNELAEADINPGSWQPITDQNKNGHLFKKNIETGRSLENSGFIEVDQKNGNSHFRLTEKAVDLLTKFSENQ